MPYLEREELAAINKRTERLEAENADLKIRVDFLSRTYLAGEVNRITAENARLREELEAAQADAARYRFLRDQHWTTGELCVVKNPMKAVKLGYDLPSGERLDAAIDAAMKEQS